MPWQVLVWRMIGAKDNVVYDFVRHFLPDFHLARAVFQGGSAIVCKKKHVSLCDFNHHFGHLCVCLK